MMDSGEAPLPDEVRRMYVQWDLRDTLGSVYDDLWDCHDRIKDDDVNHVPLRDDERAAIEPLLDAGFDLLGHGSTRIVLAMPEAWGMDSHVVKLGRYGNSPTKIGAVQNRHEVAVWADNYDGDAPLLPVCDWDEAVFGWLVMPRGVPLEETPAAEAAIDDAMEGHTQSLGVDTAEFVPSNFVRWRGGVKLADYGTMAMNIG